MIKGLTSTHAKRGKKEMHEPWMFTTIQGVTVRSTAARSALSHAVIGEDASKPYAVGKDARTMACMGPSS